jgi:hypothetical protein
MAKKKPAVKKAPVKKAPVKKAPVKKAPVKKAPVKKAPVKKAGADQEISAEARSYIRSAAADPEQEYKRACAALDKHYAEIRSLPFVEGVEVAVKLIGSPSICTGEFAIRVYVEKKINLADIPKASRILPEYSGVPTDVVVRKFKCAVGGKKISSSGLSGGLFGTLGIDVKDGNDVTRYLTAAHVVSPANSQGTTVTIFDGNTPFGKITIGPDNYRLDERFDCALVDPIPPKGINERTVGILGGPANPNLIDVGTSLDISQRLVVWKIGAKTGLRTGNLISLKTDTKDVEDESGKIRQLKEQYLVRSNGAKDFADLGDSGAIACIDDRAIGIVAAVSTDGTETLLTPLRKVETDVFNNISLT